MNAPRPQAAVGCGSYSRRLLHVVVRQRFLREKSVGSLDVLLEPLRRNGNRDRFLRSSSKYCCSWLALTCALRQGRAYCPIQLQRWERSWSKRPAPELVAETQRERCPPEAPAGRESEPSIWTWKSRDESAPFNAPFLISPNIPSACRLASLMASLYKHQTNTLTEFCGSCLYQCWLPTQ